MKNCTLKIGNPAAANNDPCASPLLCATIISRPNQVRESTFCIGETTLVATKVTKHVCGI
jgi:hypothetical protein